jgi:hypothetical protein
LSARKDVLLLDPVKTAGREIWGDPISLDGRRRANTDDHGMSELETAVRLNWDGFLTIAIDLGR